MTEKKKRQRGKSAFSHEVIAGKVGVSRVRITQMLANPDAGQNRARLTAALIEMGLTEKGAEMFIGAKQPDAK